MDNSLENWTWPFQRTNFGGAKEYECPHRVGHGGTHGCVGCCRHISFRRAERIRRKNRKLLMNSLPKINRG